MEANIRKCLALSLLFIYNHCKLNPTVEALYQRHGGDFGASCFFRLWRAHHRLPTLCQPSGRDGCFGRGG